ncbi:hypothetical protein LDENG_00188090 [Lucifuga dentata]|nr:hypothetical protein LDENG_00188090 [Lucifuga dentata]
MLGVIVLAFVLCWLPFHVGRTLFSLSRGNGVDGEDMNMDMNTHTNNDTHSDAGVDGEISTHTVTNLSDTHSENTHTQAPPLTLCCTT